MKKYTKVLALALALTMLMGMSVFAADYTVEGTLEGTSAKIDTENPNSFSVTTVADDGEMYLILVLTSGAAIPDKDTILYVNQQTASGDEITFENVYPKAIANSTIYLAGGNLDGLTPIGTIEVNSLKGDANLDTIVTADDATLIMQHLAGMLTISDTESLYNADVNGDDVITADDATKIMQYLAGMIGSLE